MSVGFFLVVKVSFLITADKPKGKLVVPALTAATLSLISLFRYFPLKYVIRDELNGITCQLPITGFRLAKAS